MSALLVVQTVIYLTWRCCSRLAEYTKQHNLTLEQYEQQYEQHVQEVSAQLEQQAMVHEQQRIQWNVELEQQAMAHDHHRREWHHQVDEQTMKFEQEKSNDETKFSQEMAARSRLAAMRCV